MATLTRGTTYSATETLTNTKLHNLVDLGSVTGIVNADISAAAAIAYSKLTLTGSVVNADINASAAIAYSKLNLSASIVNADIANAAAIADSKLAQLTTASKVHGSSITGLASVPSDAGILPVANLGTGTPSAATVLRGDGSWGTPGALEFVSNTSVSAAANTGNISITASNYYLVRFRFHSFSANDTIILRFNNDSGSNYAYTMLGQTAATTAVTAGSTSATSIALTTTIGADSGSANVLVVGTIELFAQATSNGTYSIVARTVYTTAGGYSAVTVADVGGTVLTSLSAAITSFRLLTSGGATFTGNVYTYKLNLS